MERQPTETTKSLALAAELLADWCIRNGIATAEEIDSSLKIQRAAHVTGKPRPRLDEILVARGVLTPNQVAEGWAALRDETGATVRASVDRPPPEQEVLQDNPIPIPFTSPLSSGWPERSRSVRTAAVLIVISGVVLAAGSALVHSFLPPPVESGSFEVRESEIHRAISKFRPRFAQVLACRLRDEAKGTVQEALASRLVEESAWVLRLQERVANRLDRGPVACPPHCLRRGRATGGMILSANAAGLRITRENREECVAWDGLGSVELVDIVRAVVNEPDDADLLGLGILAHRNSLTGDADGFFARLRASSLAPVAERYKTSRN